MEYESDEKILCESCEKDLTEDNADNGTGQYTCGECDGIFCADCSVRFKRSDIDICQRCINEAYPREKEVVEKVVEKIVEVPTGIAKPMGFSEPIL